MLFFIDYADNVTIMGMHARNSTAGVIYVTGSSHVTIKNNIVSGNLNQNGGIAILGKRDYTASDITIENNSLYDNHHGSIYLDTGLFAAHFEDIDITNNTIIGSTPPWGNH